MRGDVRKYPKVLEKAPISSSDHKQGS